MSKREKKNPNSLLIQTSLSLWTDWEFSHAKLTSNHFLWPVIWSYRSFSISICFQWFNINSHLMIMIGDLILVLKISKPKSMYFDKFFLQGSSVVTKSCRIKLLCLTKMQFKFHIFNMKQSDTIGCKIILPASIIIKRLHWTPVHLHPINYVHIVITGKDYPFHKQILEDNQVSSEAFWTNRATCRSSHLFSFEMPLWQFSLFITWRLSENWPFVILALFAVNDTNSFFF